MNIYFGKLGNTLFNLNDDKAKLEKQLNKLNADKKIKESTFLRKLSLLNNVNLTNYEKFDLINDLTNDIANKTFNVQNDIKDKGYNISEAIFFGFVNLWERYIYLYHVNQNNTNILWKYLFYDDDNSYKDTLNDTSLGVMYGYLFKYKNLYQDFKDFIKKDENGDYAYLGLNGVIDLWAPASNIETNDGFKYLYTYLPINNYEGEISDYINYIINLANITFDDNGKPIINDHIVTYEEFYKNDDSLVNKYINSVLYDFENSSIPNAYKSLSTKEKNDLRELLYLYSDYCDKFIIKKKNDSYSIQLGNEITELNNNINDLTNRINIIDEEIAKLCSKDSEIKATIVTAPKAKENLRYNKQPQELIEPGVAKNGVMVYSIDLNPNFVTDIPTRTNVGTYVIWYKVRGNTGYSDSNMIKMNTIYIEKSLPADVQITLNNIYEGTTPTPQYEILSGIIDRQKQNITWSYKPYDSPDTSYTTVPPSQIGKYIVKFEASENENCQATVATKIFNIVERKAYYWYIGSEDPSNMTDTSSSGWRLIGNTLPSYNQTNMLWNGDNNIAFDDYYGYYYIALPGSSLNIYNSVTNENITSHYDKIKVQTINGIIYHIYKSTVPSGGFGYNIY